MNYPHKNNTDYLQKLTTVRRIEIQINGLPFEVVYHPSKNLKNCIHRYLEIRIK